MRREPRPFTVEVRRSRVSTIRAKTPFDVQPEYPIDEIVEELPVVDVRRDEIDDEYEQAMRAADRVFAKLTNIAPPVVPSKEPEPEPELPPEPVVETQPEPVVPRRVLPSLLEQPEDPVAARLREHEERRHAARKRKSRHPKQLSLLDAIPEPQPVTEIETPQPEEISTPAEEIATVAPEPEPVERVAEAQAQPRRVQRPRTSYKDNWTYYKEALLAPTRNAAETASLRPGERWKRRLPKYAW